MATVLIVGCGYVGESLARVLLEQDHVVYGMRRNESGLPGGIGEISADVSRAETIGMLPDGIEYVVYCVAAKARDEAAYRGAYIDGVGNVLRALADECQPVRRLLFTSSTSVYGQSRGEWVDEDAPTRPLGFSGETMLLAEGLVRGSRYPSTVLRLGGIYGPGRTSLVDQVRAGQVPPASAAGFTNRIHRDDAARAIAHLLLHPDPEPLYLGVDCEPADRLDVHRWLAAELGIEARASAEETRRQAGSKRCSNALLLRSGFEFLYPTFREGYAEILQSSTARRA
jgi:nucleoside-diphosphate-sugar epimerase